MKALIAVLLNALGRAALTGQWHSTAPFASPIPQSKPGLGVQPWLALLCSTGGNCRERGVARAHGAAEMQPGLQECAGGKAAWEEPGTLQVLLAAR